MYKEKKLQQQKLLSENLASTLPDKFFKSMEFVYHESYMLFSCTSTKKIKHYVGMYRVTSDCSKTYSEDR